jgi:hypothetical protein
MLAYAEDKIAELSRLDLDGYILKRSSPSCGMERIRVPAVAEGQGPKAEDVLAGFCLPASAGTSSIAGQLYFRPAPNRADAPQPCLNAA